MKVPVELNISEEENRRQAYRVGARQRVTMTIDEVECEILDISETGIAFKTDQPRTGAIDNAVLLFSVGDRRYRFKPKLNVTFSREGRCGAEFLALSDRAHLALSELVMDIQKEQIRAARIAAEEAQEKSS